MSILVLYITGNANLIHILVAVDIFTNYASIILLLALLYISMDGRSVCISVAFPKPNFFKSDSPYDKEFCTLNKYSEFHKTLISSAGFRGTSY